MATLKAVEARAITKPGRYSDGGGLYLVVAKGGTKSWVLRITIAGKSTDKGLGGFPAVSLQQARKEAAVKRAEVRLGRNPWTKAEQQREEQDEVLERVPTFEQAARDFWQRKVPSIKSAKNQRTWLRRLEQYAFPTFGSVPVDQIKQRQVKALLEELGPRLPETARKVHQYMRDVFRDCSESEYIESNPAGDGIKGSVTLWRKHHKVKHFAALPYEQVPGIIRTIKRSKGMRETRLALAFQVLTATRSGEVRGARWEEIDRAARVWRIPAERMKSDRPHTIPLSSQALVLLQEAREAVSKREKRRTDYNPNGLVFPHPSGQPYGLVFPHPNSGQPLSENALSLRARKDKLGCTPHGFRSSFKGWATAGGRWSWEAIELCLAHRVGNSVAQAYFRDDLLEQRRPILEAWADYVWPIRLF